MCSISDSDLNGIMNNYALEGIGIPTFFQRHSLKNSPCFLAASTAHLSFHKAATILGVGKQYVVPVPVDCNARMDVKGEAFFMFLVFQDKIFI